MGYLNITSEDKKWINEVFDKLDEKLSKVTIKSRDKIPYTSVNGVHDNKADTDIGWWTNGFWGGLNWLMYQGTGKELYKTTAVVSEKMLDKVFDIPKRLDHDAGFIWHLTAGLDYRLTGDETAFNRNYKAAMSLMSRFNMKGNFIRAWNTDNAKGWSIIDCMMNLPILYWASEALGDERFMQVAISHADMAMQQHIREDGSVRHIVSHDLTTGAYQEGLTGQGYSVDSSWSRGCAWAVYGFAIAYAHTKEYKYLQTAQKVANHILANLAKTNWLPLTDFNAPATPIKYDSTAGACIACGLIEIAKHAPKNEADAYLTSAIKLLKAMEENWCNWEEDEDSILQMGMEAYCSQKNIPIIYGDFFFAEALLKLREQNFLAW